jgi:hypothetical protein
MRKVRIVYGFLVAWFLVGMVAGLFAAAFGADEDSVSAPVLWRSESVVHFIGLPEIRAKARGSLAISRSGVEFVSEGTREAIAVERILSVSSGEERVETGGKQGKIVRLVAGIAVPYGAGSLLGLVTQGQVDLLTIEFRDERGGYHGAVFVLPKGAAHGALEELSPRLNVRDGEDAGAAVPVDCEDRPGRTRAVRLLPIASAGAELPGEYRAALYEQLVRGLGKSAAFEGIYRDGDRSRAAACAGYTLQLKVEAFRKGNAVVRASAGMLGNAMGATKVKFRVVVSDARGKTVVEKELKASAKGDGESLDVAVKVAKSVGKKVKGSF